MQKKRNKIKMKNYLIRQEYFGGIIYNRQNREMNILNRTEFFRVIGLVSKKYVKIAKEYMTSSPP